MSYGVEAFVLRTAKRHWRKAYRTSVSKTPDPSDLVFNTTTESPSGGLDSGGVDQGFIDAEGCNLAKICVYGGGTSPDDKLVDTLIAGYSQVVGGGGGTGDGTLWVPSYICRLRWQIGTSAGVASADVINTEFFADNVELVDGDTSIRLITLTANNIASVTMDLEGAQWVKIQWDTGPSSEPDDFNALVSLF